MAEPSPRRRTSLAETFLPAYNALHGTSYSNPPEAEVKGGAADFRWPAPSRTGPALEVQLIVGALDPLGDRIHPRYVARASAAIQAWCDARGLRGLGIALRFSRDGQRRVSHEAVSAFVTERLAEGVRNLPPVGCTVSLDRTSTSEDSPYPRVRLSRHGEDTPAFVLASPGSAYIPVTVPRLREATERKQVDWLRGQTTDLVLLVDFDVDGYHREDIVELRAEAASTPALFREIWGISLWYPNERSDRLWP